VEHLRRLGQRQSPGHRPSDRSLDRYLAAPALAAVTAERNVVYEVLFTLHARSVATPQRARPAHGTTALPHSFWPTSPFSLWIPAYTDDTDFLVENAIYVAGHCSYLDASTSDAGHES